MRNVNGFFELATRGNLNKLLEKTAIAVIAILFFNNFIKCLDYSSLYSCF